MGNNKLFKGYWWLPSSPDDKVARVLTIEPNGKVLLELVPSWVKKGTQLLPKKIWYAVAILAFFF